MKYAAKRIAILWVWGEEWIQSRHSTRWLSSAKPASHTNESSVAAWMAARAAAAAEEAAAKAAAQAAAQAAQAAALERRATYPTLEHDNYDPGPLAERIRRDKREASHRSSDDSSSDQDTCGTGSTSEANDIFDTLDDHLGYGSDGSDDHLGYGSDSGSGW
ncbi:hypothetical protein EMIHUDRAFT_225336 [Emiliania huxleyi CCMP1516]|uniref:Uncharacterized protein n=2 Tax=Emiliania huxleyi TaxID=2903 RepID=A0A0D3KP03_EMIH1|nr:hypothetical protein EMIHUDRAFT_225336 [Emiliania huxleyi CCMP1516]EOD37488.1 hypothetical protein EMIHUDRAFT_225336 [Emiliania huxleyi CCMP1516]|eukprot:XP_005789917.1 hypothetical protein EMIHUDRAFT_225336 [Emiliania huxleyi CCMP1516]